MTARKLEIFVIVTVIAGIGIIYAFTQKPVLAPTIEVVQNQTSDQAMASATIEYQGVDGKNALDLLKVGHAVEAKHYSFGDLVTGIDGITPDANHFWAMYVNGKFSQVGASAYITKNSDEIKWKIDAVDTTK